ncbi:hypothetical protein SteCoe_24227 [Stentor coeruleus]|uniref:Uncharacterized protein n=1 Tax=Stentor coeruleus TaxID=5963 RepID=A0A1R2BHZ1_9CILI|nr:hypothetical protein SteCoe_24227 [Stentor coeruleus]
MEPRRFKSVKNIQLPSISERFFQDKNKEINIVSNLNVTMRHNTEKSTLAKNFFLPPEKRDISPIGRKSPKFKSLIVKPRVSDRRLTELDNELDKEEIAMQEFDIKDLNSLEALFASYSNYFEGLIQVVSDYSYVYKNCLVRAKNGYNTIFRKIFPKLRQIYSDQHNKCTQTLMTINPTKFSKILSKLGDIINDEISSTDKIEKHIQNKYLQAKRKSKISTSYTQTDYNTNSDGVIQYDFKSYEDLQREISVLSKLNKVLMEEKKALIDENEDSNDIEKLMTRNKILETIVIEMRNKIGFPLLTEYNI